VGPAGAQHHCSTQAAAICSPKQQSTSTAAMRGWHATSENLRTTVPVTAQHHHKHQAMSQQRYSYFMLGEGKSIAKSRPARQSCLPGHQLVSLHCVTCQNNPSTFNTSSNCKTMISRCCSWPTNNSNAACSSFAACHQTQPGMDHCRSQQHD